MNKIRNICIVDTAYTLSLYLLYMPMSDIQATLFFVGGTINSTIRNKLPNVVYLSPDKCNWKTNLLFQIAKYFRWPCFLWSSIYAQDHIAYSDILIGRKNYTFIEDSPGTFSQLDSVSFLRPSKHERGENFKRRFKYWCSHTSINGQTFGTNNQCVNRIITFPNDVNTKYIKNKPYQLVSLTDLWNNSEEIKKEFILDLFSISKQTLVDASHVDLLILSQPFVEDCGLSTEEMINLYKPYIEKYKSVVIKIHPRDKFDYKKYFPNVEIMNNQAPMQLLNAVGVVYPVALTVCSTALTAMPQETKRIYLGTKINNKIFEVYGDLYNN